MFLSPPALSLAAAGARGLNNYLKSMLFHESFGFCRRLPSRWRPLGQEGLKNYLKSLFFHESFGFCRHLPSRWRPLGQERVKNYQKPCFFLIFLVSVAAFCCKLGGGRVGLREPAGKAYGGRATLTVTCRFLFLFFLRGRNL